MASARSPASPAPRTWASARVAELANEIQRFLLRGLGWASRPSSTRSACTACWPASRSASRSRSGRRQPGIPSSSERWPNAWGGSCGRPAPTRPWRPVLDITRDPRWGRVEETYGEDPYLVAELGAPTSAASRARAARGAHGVLATGKHMVGHGVPEGGLNQAPAHIGPRELADAFLFPFEAAVRDAGLGSMMHAYDDVDGTPCVASKFLFTEVLRERWGFDGMVVSDYMGVDEIITCPRHDDDRSEAAALALEAGVDVELPDRLVLWPSSGRCGRLRPRVGGDRGSGRRARPPGQVRAGPVREPVRGCGSGRAAVRRRPRPGTRDRPAVHRFACQRRVLAAEAGSGQTWPSSGPTPTPPATCWATTRTRPTSRLRGDERLRHAASGGVRARGRGRRSADDPRRHPRSA